MSEVIQQDVKIVRTTAPISLDNLRLYFSDKNIRYVIDYENSSLKSDKLLTYLSNLDLPVDIEFDPQTPDGQDLIKQYMITSSLVEVASLEVAVLDVLFAHRFSEQKTAFSQENNDLVETWLVILDSLTLYNMYIVQDDEMKQFAQSYPKKSISPHAYLNFVNLLKYPGFYSLYEKINQDNLAFFENIFEEYIFKGKSLYEYWTVQVNPLFILTYAIASDSINLAELTAANLQDISKINNTKELDNASSC